MSFDCNNPSSSEFCWTAPPPPTETNLHRTKTRSEDYKIDFTLAEKKANENRKHYHGFQLPLSSPSLSNPDYKLRCSSCSDVVLHKRSIGDRRFIIMENCFDILCCDCVHTNQCPVCQIESERLVDLYRFVKSAEEKLQIFENFSPISMYQFSTKPKIGDLGDVGSQSQPTSLVSSLENLAVIDTALNDAGYSGSSASNQFLETGAPVITQPEEDQSESSSDPQQIFNTSKLECELCHQPVLSNPKNNQHESNKFGILENCSHIFCSCCIATCRRRCLKCPVCEVRSKRMVNLSCFVDSESSMVKYKQRIFSNLESETKIESIVGEIERDQAEERRIVELDSMKIDDHELECGLCYEKVLSNPLILRHRQFGILENCSHVFCAQCIIQHRSLTLKCPVCQLVSKRVVNLPNFVYRHEKKLQIFNRMHHQYNRH